MQTIGKTWKIGIVIPWFGKNLKGGAEQYAWQIATRLRNIGCKVTALSTCSQSFLHKWHVNYYEAGAHMEDGIDVIRFPVSKRNTHQFNKVVGKLLSIPTKQLKPGLIPINKQEEQTYWQENINSPKLISYLKQEQDSFDFFIFLPYLFPIIMKGIEAVPDKALLQPCLHDECYAYLGKTLEGIFKSRALLFNSKGEFQLAQHIYGDWIQEKSFIVGGGIEHFSMSKKYQPSKPLPDNYILYIGRKCREKNTPFLIECFDRYCHENPASKLSLILAGPASVPLPKENNKIIDLGLVDKELKSFLLSHSKALINPSINESLSRVIFESWYEGRPVIVHKKCLATYEALKDSGFSGWFVDSKEDFQSVFTLIEETSPQEIVNMGKKGQIYAKKMSDWDEVMNRYLTCFNSISPQLGNDHLEHLNNVLIVIPQSSLNRHDQVDLKEFLQALHLSGKWQIQILAKNTQVIDTYQPLQSLSIYGQNSSTLPPSLIVWYGEDVWEEGVKLIKDLKANIVQKNLLHQNFNEVKPQSNKLLPINSKDTHDWSCPNLFPPSLLQREECDSRRFEIYNKAGINILLLANFQNRDFPFITKIFRELAHRYDSKVNILIPELMDDENTLNTLNFENISCSTFKCSRSLTIPSYIYQVCDCMLIVNPVDLPPWFSIGACSHNLPVLKLSSAKEVFEDFFTLKLEMDHLNKIVALIKLACQKNSTRENLQNINTDVLKSYIPGNIQSKIEHSLQDYSAKNRAPL
ncbi:MAG: glycosyltransferase family 4 protein [Oligoflexales bacterium]